MNRLEDQRQKATTTNAKVLAAQKKLLEAFATTSDLMADFAAVPEYLESVPSLYYELYLYGGKVDDDIYIQTTKKWLQRLAMVMTSAFQFLIPQVPSRESSSKNYFTVAGTSPLAIYEMLPVTLDLVVTEGHLVYKVKEQFAL